MNGENPQSGDGAVDVLATLQSRLHEVLGNVALREAAAKASGISASTLKDYAFGRSLPTLDRFARIAAAVGRPVVWFFDVQEGMSQQQTMSTDVVMVPKLKVLAGAGPGQTASGTVQIEWSVPVPRAVLRTHNVAPDQAHFLEVVGDSMSPTLSEGATILIDRTEGQPLVNGAVYVVTLDDEVRVKRLERRASGAIALISDNRETYPVEVLGPVDAERLVIEGRVFWTERPV